MKKSPFNKLKPIPFHQIEILDDFWSKRQKINREVSIHFQHQKLEKAHHVDNFRVAAGVKEGIQEGEFYYDSDLYKWLEAASYILHKYQDSELEKKVNGIIDLIEKSQTNDGYVNTYYSTKFIHKRFTNLHVFHELYCAGHFIQAAIAHYEATGSEKLLNAAKKFADLLVRIFLGGKRKGAPGHEEIEMALVELFRITKNKNYLDLANDFINRRGKIKHFKTYALNQYIHLAKTMNLAKKINEKYKKYLDMEAEKSEVAEFLTNIPPLDWIKLIKQNFSGKLNQNNVPVREAYEPVGHAVRAMYLYCGMADLYSEIGDKSLLKALELIWLKMVNTRMYVTGGTGSIRGVEGFDKDFALKNEKSYSETCAAIGNMMWNWRMLQITGKCKYADLIEKLLYNAMLVGQSIDGKSYTYNNPLVSDGNDKRHEWFLCACCPPNIARTISSLGRYIYSISEKGIWIHQYIGSKATIKLDNIQEVNVIQESSFPWNGNVKIKLDLKSEQSFSFFLRIPKWCSEIELRVNGLKHQDNLTPGRYAEIINRWKNNDIIEIDLKMEPKLIRSDPRIKSNRGKVVISYGPLIYCLEQQDNHNIDWFNEIISKSSELRVELKPELLNGINIIRGNTLDNKIFTAVPYYVWGNRGPNKMQVWNKLEK